MLSQGAYQQDLYGDLITREAAVTMPEEGAYIIMSRISLMASGKNRTPKTKGKEEKRKEKSSISLKLPCRWDQEKPSSDMLGKTGVSYTV